VIGHQVGGTGLPGHLRLLVQDPVAAPSVSVGFCEAGGVELLVGSTGQGRRPSTGRSDPVICCPQAASC